MKNFRTLSDRCVTVETDGGLIIRAERTDFRTCLFSVVVNNSDGEHIPIDTNRLWYATEALGRYLESIPTDRLMVALFDKIVDELELSVRESKALHNANIRFVGELVCCVERKGKLYKPDGNAVDYSKPESWLRVEGLGVASIREINGALMGTSQLLKLGMREVVAPHLWSRLGAEHRAQIAANCGP